jgi:hypothetical protein
MIRHFIGLGGKASARTRNPKTPLNQRRRVTRMQQIELRLPVLLGERGRSMNQRIGIPLTMLVSFALSFGVLRWNQRRSVSPNAVEASGPMSDSMSAATPTPAVSPTPPIQSATEASAPAPPVETALPSGPAPPIEKNGQDIPELPVQLAVRSTPKRDQYFGSVANLTSAVIKFEMIVFEPDSGQEQRLPVILGPLEVRKFGKDGEASISIHAGDRVTLRGSSYRDVVDQIPAS